MNHIEEESNLVAEHWRRMENIFHLALQHDAGGRAAFLRHECGADKELRAELEELLAAHESTEDFLEEPAFTLGLTVLVRAHSELNVGERVSHYTILNFIGRGGMGEVYRARDEETGGEVALKLLPAGVTNDPERVRRFRHEARAAALIAHDNVAQVYAVKEESGRWFITLEYVDGITLRARLAEPLSLTEAMDIAGQVAHALHAAHSRNVLHRDLKPENVMLRRDGRVKILDFGLAKLTKPILAAHKDAHATAPSNLLTDRTATEPGIILGTSLYMSPEQARGTEVDERTDIWSFGVLLYEMLAGTPPFRGATSMDTLAAVLTAEPKPLNELVPRLPASLSRLVHRALRKEPKDRQQSSAELLEELRLVSHAQDATVAERWENVSARFENEASAEQPTQELHVQTASRRNVSGGRGMFLLLGALILAASIFVVGFYGLWGESQPEVNRRSASSRNMRFDRLTATGKAGDVVAISPDGKRVAHVAADAGRLSLRVKAVGAPGELQIVSPAEVAYWGVTFSHDGNRMYYVVKEKNSTIGVLYGVSAAGGEEPHKLVENVDGPVALSPDDREVAFVRRHPVQKEDVLMIARADGTGERQLAARKFPNSFSFCGPSWSPDGKTIAVGAGLIDSGGLLGVELISVADGRETTLAQPRWRNLDGLVWLGDSSELLLSAAEGNSSSFQLWGISYPGGELRRVTNDLHDYHSLGITADSGTLVTVLFDQLSNVWTTPPGADEAQATQISSGRYDGYFGVAWTPDGRIVYGSMASNKPDIWIMEADGTQAKQLTDSAELTRTPVVSPDGRSIFFVRNKNEAPDIWKMGIDGSDAKPLTNSGANWPATSPDGRWVAYTSVGTANRLTLWRVPVDGGDAAQLTDKLSLKPMISPDGKWIACVYRDAQTSPWKIAVIPSEGGAPLKIFDIPRPYNQIIRWSPGADALAYLDAQQGVSNVWFQPMDGGRPKRLTNFRTGQIFAYDWSRDGKQLACARGTETRDVILIKDFR